MAIRYSLIIPVYKNEPNIEDLLQAVSRLHDALCGLEVVFVVDGSPDRSWELLHEGLKQSAITAQLLHLSRNFGSFAAIRTGMMHARGEYLAVMAADLQEPPELVLEFFTRLSAGECDVVMGTRAYRHDPFVTRFLSNTFWRLYRKYVLPEMPRGGVDIFGCTREVAGTMEHMREANSSLVAQLFWVGYRRAFVPYTRRAREKGTSAWTVWKKVKYLLDSVFSFSELPLVFLLWTGAAGFILSAGLGFVTLVAKLLGLITVPGYTALLLVILFLFSVVILSQGIMGCYLWRCFENTKQRPLTIVSHKECFGQENSAVPEPDDIYSGEK